MGDSLEPPLKRSTHSMSYGSHASASAANLRELREGATVLSLHRMVLEKTEAFGRATERLLEAPEVLQSEKVALQSQLNELRAADEARHSASALAEEASLAERNAAALAQAQETAQQREQTIKQLTEQLQAAKLEIEASRRHASELQRELADERVELHKLRQERRLTVPPSFAAPRMPHGNTSSVPPFTRHLEHPELESPRPPSSVPPSASAPRRATSARVRPARSCGMGAGGALRPAASRPMSAQAPVHVAAGSASAAAAMLEAAPDLNAPFAEFAAFFHPPSASGRAAGGSAASAGRAAASAGGLSSRERTAIAAGYPATRRRDVALQTEPSLPESHWEERAKDLQRANARLQTALLAAALDQDGTMRSALQAVNRANVSTKANSRPTRAGSASARRPAPLMAALPPALHEWPPMA